MIEIIEKTIYMTAFFRNAVWYYNIITLYDFLPTVYLLQIAAASTHTRNYYTRNILFYRPITLGWPASWRNYDFLISSPYFATEKVIN